MVTQVATRFGFMDEDVAAAARRRIEETATPGVEALEAAWRARPDEDGPPVERWAVMLSLLFPSSPAVREVPAGDGEENLRLTRRLFAAAASFLAAAQTRGEDAEADDCEGEAGRAYAPVRRATHALLDYAESALPLA